MIRALSRLSLSQLRRRCIDTAVVAAVLCCTYGLAQAAPKERSFTFANVIRIARKQAAQAFRPVPRVPGFLTTLSYDQYQAIRFKPTKSLWYGSRLRFHVEAIPPGLYYNHCVTLDVVRDGAVLPLRFPRDDFTYPSKSLEQRLPPQLCAAGFKLTYPLAGPQVQNQFLVFAGASYFRAVGRPNWFGLSARGIAINTAFPPTEEFPAFRRFWLREPHADSKTFILYALLDGPSVTGAYRFSVVPGQATVMDVKADLFFRHTPRVIGIAPLTSMFLYGENTPRLPGEWRPAVHDSDGLQIENGDGEWIWRPLINPVHFLVASFKLDNPRGFGLMQRNQRFAAYEDLEARYDLRPSAWVLPQGNWGAGRVELVEIPSQSETEDNIVAYWVPQAPSQPGREYRYQYRLVFGQAQTAQPPAGYVVHTFVGSGRNPGLSCTADQDSLRFLVDFKAPYSSHAGAVDGVVSAGEHIQVSDVSVVSSRTIHGYRLSFLVAPERGRPLELRAFLRRGSHALTETWSYLLPWDNAERLLATPGCPYAPTVQSP
jgi:glucans biosynthesis protein